MENTSKNNNNATLLTNCKLAAVKSKVSPYYAFLKAGISTCSAVLKKNNQDINPVLLNFIRFCILIHIYPSALFEPKLFSSPTAVPRVAGEKALRGFNIIVEDIIKTFKMIEDREVDEMSDHVHKKTFKHYTGVGKQHFPTIKVLEKNVLAPRGITIQDFFLLLEANAWERIEKEKQKEEQNL